MSRIDPNCGCPCCGPDRLANAVVLMFVRGWQGGTVHQIAAELGVTVDDVQTADADRMGELMREAQGRQRAELLKRYANAAERTAKEIHGDKLPCKPMGGDCTNPSACMLFGCDRAEMRSPPTDNELASTPRGLL